MPVSGTYEYTRNTRQMIKDALIEAGVISDHESVRGDMYDWSLRRLNLIIKHLQTRGLQLWRTVDVALLLENGVNTYRLGDTARWAEGLVSTEVRVAASSTDTTLEVDSTSGMTASDIIGIELDDGTIQWSSISSITDSDTLVLNDALTGDAAVDNVIHTYTTLAPKPLRVHDCYHVTGGDRDGNHLPLTLISGNEYFTLNNKLTSGRSNSVYFRPDTTYSEVQVWPVPDNSVDYLVFRAQMPFSNMVDQTDDVQFPDWWYEPLHLSLAHALARSYQAPPAITRTLKSDAEQAVQEAENYDVETVTIWIHPDHPQYDH